MTKGTWPVAGFAIGSIVCACDGKIDLGPIGRDGGVAEQGSLPGANDAGATSSPPSPPGTQHAAPSPGSCIQSGITYSRGATWRCPDGCNTCSCDNPPAISTTTIACGVTTSSVSCWSNQVPEVQSISPKASVDAVCAGAVSGPPTWGSVDAGSSDDAKFKFVGRWVSCGSGMADFTSLPHDGVEFGANGRWRLLVKDSTGSLVPMTSTTDQMRGPYYALTSGQMDVRDDTFTSLNTVFPAFSAAGDGVSFKKGLYARTTPSPTNGSDNSPSTTDGVCTLAGTWDVPADTTGSAGAPAATFSFDSLGNFVGGPAGVDLCTSHTMYGTYRLTPGLFQLTQNVGMGICDFWFDAGFVAAFDSTCSHMTITQMWDDCTGGRGYFNDPTTLTRRP